MVNPGPFLAVAAGDDDAPDLRVALQVLDSVAVHREDPDQLIFARPVERQVVSRVLHQDLAGPADGHAVEHAHPLPDQLFLDHEVGVPLRDDSHLPPRRVGLAAVGAIGGDLARGQALVTRAERAVVRGGARADRLSVADKDPLTRRGVLPQLSWHDQVTYPATTRGPFALVSRKHQLCRDHTERRRGLSSLRGGSLPCPSPDPDLARPALEWCAPCEARRMPPPGWRP